MLTVEERAFLEAMAAKHLPGRHDQSTHGRRRGSHVTEAAANAVDVVAGAATQVAERPKPQRRRRPDPASDKPAGRVSAGVPTWEDLGRPSGPPPVGQVIGHEGGTYELLPGEPRRYRVIAADGRDISNQVPVGVSRRNGMNVPSNQTAEDARSALLMDAEDRGRRESDARSQWRKTMAAVPGAYHLDSGEISGFAGLSPERLDTIQSALRSWKEDIFDSSRGVEPNVNAALRGRMPHTGKTRRDVEALDVAFGASKTSRAITVYRGINDGQHILPADWRTRNLEGLEWSDGAYTATSAKKDFAAAYVGEPDDRGFGVRIKLPKGSPAIALPDTLGGLDAEGEIILPRGLTFRVVKDNGAQGRLGLRWLDVEATPSAKSADLDAQTKSFLDGIVVKHLPGEHNQQSHGRHGGSARWITADDAMAMRAKMLEGEPWTFEQQDALNRYVGSAYGEMNGLLRGDRETTEGLSDGEREEFAGLIRDAAAGMRPTTEPVKVKRFVGGFESFGFDMTQLTRDEAAEALKAMKGKTLQEPGFMSTSVLEGFGKETWLGKFKLELDVPQGAQGAFLDGDVGFANEQELLLAPGTAFEITDVVIDPPHNTVKGRVVVS